MTCVSAWLHRIQNWLMESGIRVHDMEPSPGGVVAVGSEARHVSLLLRDAVNIDSEEWAGS